MKLVRYQHPLTEAFGELDRWFRSPLDGFGRLVDLADRLGALPAPSGLPSAYGADLYEDDHHYHVRLELPGVKKSDLSVELHEHQLTIAAERQATPESPNAQTTVFKRVLTVPEGIAADAVTARLEDGILTVTLPKSAERRPRQIAVN